MTFIFLLGRTHNLSFGCLFVIRIKFSMVNSCPGGGCGTKCLISCPGCGCGSKSAGGGALTEYRLCGNRERFEDQKDNWPWFSSFLDTFLPSALAFFSSSENKHTFKQATKRGQEEAQEGWVWQLIAGYASTPRPRVCYSDTFATQVRMEGQERHFNCVIPGEG